MIQKLKSTLGLSFQLAKANFKLKNEGSYLGYLWYLLEPLATFIIFILIRGVIRGGKSPNYGLYLIIGLVVFNFFRNITTSSAISILKNRGFIKTTNIQKEVFVISDILQATFSHIIEIFVLIIFLLIFNIPIVRTFFYIFIFMIYLIFNTGLAFLLATIGIYISDLSNIWKILARLLWFATPIFYTVKPGELLYNLNQFNPLYYFVTSTRDFILYGTLPTLGGIIKLILMSIVVFIIGILIFNKNKNKFADLV